MYSSRDKIPIRQKYAAILLVPGTSAMLKALLKVGSYIAKR